MPLTEQEEALYGREERNSPFRRRKEMELMFGGSAKTKRSGDHVSRSGCLGHYIVSSIALCNVLASGA